MPIINPTQLVDEFKKSGEFDRLRRELLAQFRDGDEAFLARVEDIVRQRLTSDLKLQFMPDAAAERELMQELDRYPVVERAVTDLAMLTDPAFASGIRDTVKKLLQQDRIDHPPSDNAPPSASTATGTNITAALNEQPAEDGHNSGSEHMSVSPPSTPGEERASYVGPNVIQGNAVIYNGSQISTVPSIYQ